MTWPFIRISLAMGCTGSCSGKLINVSKFCETCYSFFLKCTEYIILKYTLFFSTDSPADQCSVLSISMHPSTNYPHSIAFEWARKPVRTLLASFKHGYHLKFKSQFLNFINFKFQKLRSLGGGESLLIFRNFFHTFLRTEGWGRF